MSCTGCEKRKEFLMNLFRPYSTLAVGILIGWFVVPKIAGKLNLPVGA